MPRVRGDFAPTKSARPAPLLAVSVAVALCFIVPVSLWSILDPSSEPTTETLVTSAIVLSGARFSWIVGSRVRRIHEFVVWMFAYLFLGIAPFVQLRSVFPSTTPGVTPEFSAAAAGISLAGLACLVVGSWWAGHRDNNTEDAPQHLEPLSASRIYVLTGVTWALALYYIVQVGPASLFVSRSDAVLARSASLDGPFGILLTSGAKFGLLVAFVALVHLWKTRSEAGKPRPVFATVTSLLLLLAITNPISNARYEFGTVALAILAAFGTYSSVWRFRAFSIAALVGMVVAFPVLDTFRRTLDATIQFESPLDSLTTGDFDAFAQIMNVCQYVSEQGIVWGQQFLGVVLFWLPRQVWPGKPIDTGTMIADYKGYQFQNLSAPLWAEFFINFGWIGLIAGMVMFGYLIRRLDNKSELKLQLFKSPGIAATVIPFYLILVLRGSLLMAMTNLVVIILAAWFVTARHRNRSKSSALVPRGIELRRRPRH